MVRVMMQRAFDLYNEINHFAFGTVGKGQRNRGYVLRLLSGTAKVARWASFFGSGGVVSMSSALRLPLVLSLLLREVGVGVLGSMVIVREVRAGVGVMVEGGRRN
jgi:hypothetical protein